MSRSSRATILRPRLGLALVGPVASVLVAALVADARHEPPNELDAFMARALERREESWRRLHDYVLDEAERFAIVGPGRVRLHGLEREFTWYVRDGFFVRSPVKANGVAVEESERRRYEDRWFDRERSREAARQAKARGGPETPANTAAGVDVGEDEIPDPDSLVRQGGEPRFISEAYFLKFKFEPGNYYLVGREQLEGREVLRIEYYPRRMFSDDRRRSEEPSLEVNLGPEATPKAPEADAQKTRRGRERAREPGEVDEADLDRKFDKVAVITLWVDPVEHHIVKYTFDNVGLDFLPGRWIVRFDDLRASMTMGRFFDSLWLPREIRFEGGFTLASGSYSLEYARTFAGYRKAETSAVIRGYAPKEP